MEALLNRYRNLTVVVLLVVAQLLLLAYQIKGQGEVRLIRTWAVSAVMPLARLLDGARFSFSHFTQTYIRLIGVKEENRLLRRQLDSLRLENHHLKTQLSTAERAQALLAFQAANPSRTVAARIIATGTGASSKIVFVDRGTESGVAKGMAVIRSEGAVGKVLAAFPGASQVMLINDPNFAAGVVSQRNRVKGTLRGRGQALCYVDFISSEAKVVAGEWFYTSGDDRIFPKGLPVGIVATARVGSSSNKEIYIQPSGLQQTVEEVLIVLDGVHQAIPLWVDPNQPLHLLPAPADPAEASPNPAPGQSVSLQTEADRLFEKYRQRTAPLQPASSPAGNPPAPQAQTPAGAPGGNSQPAPLPGR